MITKSKVEASGVLPILGFYEHQTHSEYTAQKMIKAFKEIETHSTFRRIVGPDTVFSDTTRNFLEVFKPQKGVEIQRYDMHTQLFLVAAKDGFEVIFAAGEIPVVTDMISIFIRLKKEKYFGMIGERLFYDYVCHFLPTKKFFYEEAMNTSESNKILAQPILNLVGNLC